MARHHTRDLRCSFASQQPAVLGATHVSNPEKQSFNPVLCMISFSRPHSQLLRHQSALLLVPSDRVRPEEKQHRRDAGQGYCDTYVYPCMPR